MKNILLLVTFIVFNTSLLAQAPPNPDVEYYITELDTSYVENEHDDYLTMLITKTTGDIKSYKGETVYTMPEVDKEPENEEFRMAFNLMMVKAIKEFRDKLTKGKYTFSINDLLISKEGKIGHYLISLPQKNPFNTLEEISKQQKVDNALGNWLRRKMVRFIEDNNTWRPAIRDRVAVNSYFDEPIEMSINIK